MPDFDADVIVIGGGPGGSCAATMLARSGWRVVLFERERFPREHIGESLLPASLPILKELGALPAVEAAGFLKKWGATMVWGTSPEPWSWHFRETNQRQPHSYQVWRPQFDKILLDNARTQGVDVREGHRVLEVLFEGDRATGVRVSNKERAAIVSAHFIVDASGQEGVIGRARRLRKPDAEFRNLAMYAYFRDAETLPSPDESNIFIESYPEGWTWVIPLHTGLTSVGFVVDSKVGQAAIARDGLEGAYAHQLAQSTNTARMLRNATRASETKVIRDWSYVSDAVAGDGYVLVGDAACFIDPLFSTGVHLALSAGVLGAAYVTTALRNPGLREPSAEVYRELYYQQYYLFRELARLFYASNRTVDSYFWEARRILNPNDAVAPRAAFIRAAAGQPPKGYERMVLEHGVPPDDFVSGVRAVETARVERRVRYEARAADGAAALGAAVPVTAPGVAIVRKPVLGAGEFVMGYVLAAPDLPDGLPVSALVAGFVERIDGVRSLADLARGLGEGLEDARAAQVGHAILDAARVLYIDGIIAELRGL
jgi:flavin-dependent dehydrogenase